MRGYALLALKEMAPDSIKALPTLLAGLKDKSAEVRCVACDALGRLGPKAEEAVPALAALVKDSAVARMRFRR